MSVSYKADRSVANDGSFNIRASVRVQGAMADDALEKQRQRLVADRLRTDTANNAKGFFEPGNTYIVVVDPVEKTYTEGTYQLPHAVSYAVTTKIKRLDEINHEGEEDGRTKSLYGRVREWVGKRLHNDDQQDGVVDSRPPQHGNKSQ